MDTSSFQSSPASEGRGDCMYFFVHCTPIVFQSSPASEGRCDDTSPAWSLPHQWFQSSPASEGRCDRTVKRWAEVAGCFNPHRLLRAGATDGRQRERALVPV